MYNRFKNLNKSTFFIIHWLTELPLVKILMLGSCCLTIHYWLALLLTGNRNHEMSHLFYMPKRIQLVEYVRRNRRTAIHWFIAGIYIALLQVGYSEALLTPAQPHKTILSLDRNSWERVLGRQRSDKGRPFHIEGQPLRSHVSARWRCSKVQSMQRQIKLTNACD